MALPRRKAGSQAPAHRGGQPRRPVETDNPFTVNEPDVDDDDLIEDVDGDDDGYDEDPVYQDSRSQSDDGFADEDDYDDEEISEPAEQDDGAYVEDPDDDGLGSAELEEEPEPEPSPRRGRGNQRGGNKSRIRNSRNDGPRGRGRNPMRQDAPNRKSMMSGFSGLMKSGKDKTKAVAKPQRNATGESSSSLLLLSVSASMAGFAIFLFMLGIFLGILHPGSGSLVLVFVLLLALPFIGLFGGLVSLKKDASHKSAAITAIIMSLVSILTVGIMYMQMDTITKKIDDSIEQAVSLVNNMNNTSSNSLTDEDSGVGHYRTGSSTSKRSSSTNTKSKSSSQSDSNDDSDSGSSSSSDSGQLKSE